MTVMTTGKDGQDSNGAKMPSAVSSFCPGLLVSRADGGPHLRKTSSK